MGWHSSGFVVTGCPWGASSRPTTHGSGRGASPAKCSGRSAALIHASRSTPPNQALQRTLASARAAEFRRWVAGRSVAAWRGPGKKKTQATRRHAHPSQGRCQVWLQTAGVLFPLPLGGPEQAGGAARASSGVRGRRGGSRPPQQCGSCRALAHAGPDTHRSGRCRVPMRGAAGGAACHP